MKHLTFNLVMTLCLLSAFPSMADETRLQHLVSQAKAAISVNDDKAVDRLSDEIYALTTGLDPALEETLEQITSADYQKKFCPYRKAIAPLMTAEDIEYFHHKARFEAFRIVFKKEENAPYVLAIIECVQDNGDPVPESLALKEGIEWARKLEGADASATQTMAQEYELLIQRQPDNQLYQWIYLITVMAVDGHRLDALATGYNKLLSEGLYYQAKLVEKADKGDLVTQLEVALRLETGDKFKQSNRFAYFWYKRALQNGGGESAQNGMERLHPQLDWLDHELVDMWLDRKSVV